MRDRLIAETKAAMLAKNKERLSTLRLINAALKDRDIAARSEENSLGVSNSEILEILSKMIRQRIESVKLYEEGGRIELAESERFEILVIKEFMPKQLSEIEINNVINDAINKLGAESIRDMGKVMASLKANYSGKADFSKISVLVKELLLDK